MDGHYDLAKKAMRLAIEASGKEDINLIRRLVQEGDMATLRLVVDSGVLSLTHDPSMAAATILPVLQGAMDTGVARALATDWMAAAGYGTVERLTDLLCGAYSEGMVSSLIALGADPFAWIAQNDGCKVTPFFQALSSPVTSGAIALLRRSHDAGGLPVCRLNPDGTRDTAFSVLLGTREQDAESRACIILDALEGWSVPRAWALEMGRVLMQAAAGGRPTAHSWRVFMRMLSNAEFEDPACWRQVLTAPESGFTPAYWSAYNESARSLRIIRNVLDSGLHPDELSVTFATREVAKAVGFDRSPGEPMPDHARIARRFGDAVAHAPWLHAAVISDNAPAVELLLDAGADPRITSSALRGVPAGADAFEMAEMFGAHRCRSLLAAWAARRSVTDVMGRVQRMAKGE